MLDINPQPHQEMFLACNGDELTEAIRIVFFGGGAGGGKTWSILVDNLFGIHDPDYFSAFFRSTTIELETNLWPEAKKLYMPLLQDEDGKWIGKSHINERMHVITFPSGAKSKFAYMQHEKDADAWYGAEIAKVYIDEFQMHTPYTFETLRSRNRSIAKVPKGMRFTLNPDQNHFCYEWVRHFIDEETGYPIKELGGKVRYYVIVSGVLKTSWDKQELKDETGKNPLTYTYIPATLEDNKVLMEQDASYRDVLDSMNPTKRNQLLLGCWKSVEDGGLFDRTWVRGEDGEKVKKYSDIPTGLNWYRGVDKGYSTPSESNKYPDFTAMSSKFAKDRYGMYWMVGDFHPDTYDKDQEDLTPSKRKLGRFRELAGNRDSKIVLQGKLDGESSTIVLTKDTGGAATDHTFTVSRLVEERINVAEDKSPKTTPGKKLKDFTPFSNACQLGLVYIVEESYTTATLEAIYAELEKFDGVTKSSTSVKDDWADSHAMGFAQATTRRTFTVARTNQKPSPTKASQILKQQASLKDILPKLNGVSIQDYNNNSRNL